MYSIIALRSLSIAPYLTIDRSNDKNVYKNLKMNFNKQKKGKYDLKKRIYSKYVKFYLNNNYWFQIFLKNGRANSFAKKLSKSLNNGLLVPIYLNYLLFYVI